MNCIAPAAEGEVVFSSTNQEESRPLQYDNSWRRRRTDFAGLHAQLVHLFDSIRRDRANLQTLRSKAHKYYLECYRNFTVTLLVSFSFFFVISMVFFTRNLSLLVFFTSIMGGVVILAYSYGTFLDSIDSLKEADKDIEWIEARLIRITPMV
jgi:hypothetical protein